MNVMHQFETRNYSRIKAHHIEAIVDTRNFSRAEINAHGVQNAYLVPQDVITLCEENRGLAWHKWFGGIESQGDVILRSRIWDTYLQRKASW